MAKSCCIKSLSARRAWIEIPVSGSIARLPPVALRKESVDRNRPQPPGAAAPQVALRKESVDRNILRDRRHWQMGHVALRKESVDRNGNAQVSGDARVCRSPQGERG